MGVTIRTNVALGTDITLESLKAEGYAAVFLATGLHDSRKLNIAGEDLEGILPGVAFLRDAALGRPIALGKRVVVVGGGNVAIDVALTAKRLGAEKVTMVCLETRDEMPAWDYEIEEAVEEKIDISNCLGPNRFVGDNGRLQGIEFKQCTCVFDENNCFNPQYNEDQKEFLEADTAIVAIGQGPELAFTQQEGIAVTPRGGLEADPLTLETPLPWVFAGGDGVYGPKSVVEAVASGKEAAESIDRYHERSGPAGQAGKKSGRTKNPITQNETGRQRMPMRTVPWRSGSAQLQRGRPRVFRDGSRRQEAERCLKCGICSECYQCVEACLAKAVDHTQVPLDRDLRVGSVVLSSATTSLTRPPWTSSITTGPTRTC